MSQHPDTCHITVAKHNIKTLAVYLNLLIRYKNFPWSKSCVRFPSWEDLKGLKLVMETQLGGSFSFDWTTPVTHWGSNCKHEGRHTKWKLLLSDACLSHCELCGFYLIFKDRKEEKVNTDLYWFGSRLWKKRLFQLQGAEAAESCWALHLQANWKSLRKETHWNTYFSFSAIILRCGGLLSLKSFIFHWTTQQPCGGFYFCLFTARMTSQPPTDRTVCIMSEWRW